MRPGIWRNVAFCRTKRHPKGGQGCPKREETTRRPRMGRRTTSRMLPVRCPVSNGLSSVRYSPFSAPYSFRRAGRCAHLIGCLSFYFPQLRDNALNEKIFLFGWVLVGCPYRNRFEPYRLLPTYDRSGVKNEDKSTQNILLLFVLASFSLSINHTHHFTCLLMRVLWTTFILPFLPIVQPGQSERLLYIHYVIYIRLMI